MLSKRTGGEGAILFRRRTGDRKHDPAPPRQARRRRRHQWPRQCGPSADDVRPAGKTLLADLDELGIPLDNVEGMAFGPELPDGRRTLLVASDNFSPAGFTQFLVFVV